MIRISAVSYLNTFPFVMGLESSGILQDIVLELDVPSICAKKFRENQVDIALIPTGALREMDQFSLISSYCIGAVRAVKTVLLLSHKPLDQIRTIALDFDSRTSIQLVRILSTHYWHIDPEYHDLSSGEAGFTEQYDAMVAIGDKTFVLGDQYPCVYDLAEQWIAFTKLPMVFAVWGANKPLSASFLEQFDKALTYGITHLGMVPEYFSGKLPEHIDVMQYLREHISYDFDEPKKAGMARFLELIGN